MHTMTITTPSPKPLPVYPFDYTPSHASLRTQLEEAGWEASENTKWYICVSPPDAEGNKLDLVFPKLPHSPWEMRHYAQTAMVIMGEMEIIRLVYPDSEGWYVAQEVLPPEVTGVLTLCDYSPSKAVKYKGEDVHTALYDPASAAYAHRGFSDRDDDGLHGVTHWRYLPNYPTGVRRHGR